MTPLITIEIFCYSSFVLLLNLLSGHRRYYSSHQSLNFLPLTAFPEKVWNIKCQWLTKECNPHPLIETMKDSLLLVVLAPPGWPYSRLQVMLEVSVWQGEGGMGPTESIEYSTRHSLQYKDRIGRDYAWYVRTLTSQVMGSVTSCMAVTRRQQDIRNPMVTLVIGK